MSATPPKGTTSTPLRRLRLDELRSAPPPRRIPGRNGTKADILVYRVGALDVAVKDYSARPWLVRQSLGRLLIRRESAAYRVAEGTPGIPRFFGRLGPFALATEWIDAQTLSEYEDRSVDDDRFEQALAILQRLHARGVALADLSYRDLLLTEGGRVYLIDLAMSVVLGERPGPLRRRVFAYLRQSDLWALARLRARFSRCVRPPEVGEGAAAPAVVAWHRRARRVKWVWDKLRGAPRLPPVD